MENPRRASLFSAIFEIFAVASPSAAVETVAFPLAQDPDFYLFEFACHEGNYWSMRSMQGGARVADRSLVRLELGVEEDPTRRRPLRAGVLEKERVLAGRGHLHDEAPR